MADQRQVRYSDERELEADYPIHPGHWYLVNGEPWKSNTACYAGDLLKTGIIENGVPVQVTSVASCNVSARRINDYDPFGGGEPDIEEMFSPSFPGEISEDELDALFMAKLQRNLGGSHRSLEDHPAIQALMEHADEISAGIREGLQTDEMKFRQYVSKTPVLIEGNVLRYDMEQAQAIIARAPEALKLGHSPDLRKAQSEYMERFMRSRVQLKEPNVDIVSVANGESKHFMMVSPSSMPVFFGPEDWLKKWSRWEALRRALEMSGARVTIQDPRNDRDAITHFPCRDSYASVNNVAYIPDYKTFANKMSGAAFSGIVGVENTANDGPRLISFFNKRNQTNIVVKRGSVCGGNIIPHPQSKTVFMGVEKNPMDMLVNLPEVLSFQAALDKTQNAQWEVVPILLNEMDMGLLGTSQRILAKEAPTFYHLDTAMSEPLVGGEVLVCAPACEYHGLMEIFERVGESNIVSVTPDEGKMRVPNLVSNDYNIVVSRPSERLRGKLQDKGYALLTADDFGVERFGFGDADAHCLTNMIETPEIG